MLYGILVEESGYIVQFIATPEPMRNYYRDYIWIDKEIKPETYYYDFELRLPLQKMSQEIEEELIDNVLKLRNLRFPGKINIVGFEEFNIEDEEVEIEFEFSGEYSIEITVEDVKYLPYNTKVTI
jgi:hypothetical protein